MKFPSEQQYAAFSNFMDHDIERFDRLSEQFDKIESIEKSHGSSKFRKKQKYERMFRGAAKISSISKSKLLLNRKNGTPLGELSVSREITKIILKSDVLDVTLGLRDKEWRLIRLHSIQTKIPENLSLLDAH